MTRKSYYKTVAKIIYREFQGTLWYSLHGWVEKHQPNSGPSIPRKPTKKELALEANGKEVYYSGFYSYRDMVDKILPAFKKH